MTNQSPSDMVLSVEVIQSWATRYKEAGYAPEAVLEYVAWESAQWGADQELEHYTVPYPVYIYIRQLENAIKYDTNGVKRLYPFRFGDKE